jgi:serine/threonine protein kinase
MISPKIYPGTTRQHVGLLSLEEHMPETGQNISHYSIVEKIGKGGMGEVFRAKDQKLGREVAIKVLPEEFAKDTDRVARFQREAKLLRTVVKLPPENQE